MDILGNLKLVAALVAFVFVAGVLALDVYWKHKADELPALHHQIAQLETDYARLQADIARQSEESDRAAQSYLDEVHRQQALAAGSPVPVVRLCEPARTVYLPAPARSPVRATPAAAPAGTLPPVAGPDIEIDTRRLYDLADEADRISAQLRALLSLKDDDHGSGSH